MKKMIMLGMTAILLILTACNKGAFSSQLKFSVSNEFGTRAVLNGTDESGLDIVWEEGDLIEYTVEVYRYSSQDPGVNLKKISDKMEGYLAYENGSWVTYEARGSSFTQVDHISVRSSSLENTVRSRFHCENGNYPSPDCFVAEWVQTIPFAEGEQTMLVKLPFGDRD